MPDESVSAESSSRRLRRLLGSGTTLVVPGASNALTARLIEEAGFDAVYATGAGIANSYLGVPDIGLLSLPELAGHVAAMRNVLDLPLIVDADTGFGSAINTWHAVRTLERAGATAIQIEDQTFPKRCGHFEGKAVIDAEEMAEKIRASVDARTDPDMVIIARTDARSELGLEEACRRANHYREAGADVSFVEAPQTELEIEIVAREVEGPKVLNIVEGGKTPHLPIERIRELGYTVALYANLPLLAGIHATRELLEHLRANGDDTIGPPHATWEERQRLVRKDWFDDLGDRYRQRP